MDPLLLFLIFLGLLWVSFSIEDVAKELRRQSEIAEKQQTHIIQMTPDHKAVICGSRAVIAPVSDFDKEEVEQA